jgi:hypothetical protein
VGERDRGRGPGELATVHVTETGERWSKRLAPGAYTVPAVHSDDAGHISRGPAHTFSIGPPPGTIGSTDSSEVPR